MRKITSICAATIFALGALVIAAPSDAAPVGAICTAGKLKATGKKAQMKLNCHKKAANTGAITDTVCLNTATTKFSSAFTKAETKPPCYATGDTPTIETKVDNFVDAVVATLRPVLTESKCTKGELGAAGKKASAKLNCHQKAAKKGLKVDPGCLSDAEVKFNTQYAVAVGKGDCLTGTTAATIEAMVDAFVSDAAATLRPGPLSACTGEKLKSTALKANEKLTCHAKATADGLTVDPACLMNAETKFSANFTDAEGSADCLQPTGDAAAIETRVDTFVSDVETALRPVVTLSKCTSKKLDAAGAEAKKALSCRGNSVRNGLPANSNCLSPADLDDKFAKAEGAADCAAPTGDATTIEGMVDGLIDDIEDDLIGTTTTSTTTTTF